MTIMNVPKLMATQHPDSTIVFTAQEEVKEAIEDVLPLERGGRGCDEKMIDYEGKATPYNQIRAVIEESKYYDLVPGEDFLITPRIPNPRLEDKDRHLLTITAAITANMYSQLYFDTNAVKYLILPMSSSTLELAEVQRRIIKVQRLVSEEFSLRGDEIVRLIPLFETAESHMHIDEIIEGLRVALIKEVGLVERDFRIFVGKSDSAINSGHLASSIAIKMALLKMWRWQEDTMFRSFPIVGMGKPPMRGHMAEWVKEDWVEAWKGYYTATVQSALRFNTNRIEYVSTILKVMEGRGRKPDLSQLNDQETLVRIAWRASEKYTENIDKLAEHISFMAKLVIGTRARLETYKRKAKTGKELPRAIRFCAALYSMGLGPTIIGASVIDELAKGRGELLSLLLKFLPLLKKDWGYDLHLTDLETFKRYVDEKTFEKIKKDVETIREYLGDLPTPRELPEEYFELLRDVRNAIESSDISRAKANIVKLAELRGFLG